MPENPFFGLAAHTMSRICLDNNTSKKTSLFPRNHSLLLSYFLCKPLHLFGTLIFKRVFNSSVRLNCRMCLLIMT